MRRSRFKLTAAAVANAKVGRHRDGGGLILQASRWKNGPLRKSWILRIRFPDGTVRDVGLGSADVVDLALARSKADEIRKLIAQGVDPIAKKASDQKPKAVAPTFNELTEKYISSKEAGWSSSKHAGQWRSSLSTYAAPVIGHLRADEIEISHMLEILEPLWGTKTETASRVRQRTESILEFAAVFGYRDDATNPARWHGRLEHALAKRSKVQARRNFAAMPYQKLPAFMSALRARSELSARALEFTILTFARTSEAIEAAWTEIDFQDAVWTVPASRMKMRRTHKVPLSADAVRILRALEKHRHNEFVFSEPGQSRPMSKAAMSALLKRMDVSVTVHGFRSSAKTFFSEETHFENIVSEMALAHTIKSATEAAYRRGELLERRRELGLEWSDFCYGRRKLASERSKKSRKSR